MIYTAIDTFYVTDEQLKNSPSRKDGIDESTELTLRIYGCDLIQESGILLKLPQSAMATGQVLFHRFYCKTSFARFNVKRVAASCIWLASKLEECPRRAKLVFNVFHRIESRRENKPVEHLDLFSKKYANSKMDLNDTERHLLIKMGFICHVEHPHKFILSYLKALDTPEELRQESWNLANDSLRTTLCVRFKNEVVACGVVYVAARKFQVPLPEDPPWWEVFDAKKSEIDEVCSVLAHLYSLPKAQYISICEDNMSFALANRTQDPQVPHNNTNNPTVATNPEADASNEAMFKEALDKLKELKSNDDIKSLYTEAETKEAAGVAKSRVEHRTDVNRGRNRDIDKKRSKVCDCESRGSGWEMEQKEYGWKREKLKERRHRVEGKGKDIGHPEKSKHYSSRDRSEYYGSSYTSSRERDRHRHHPYA